VPFARKNIRLYPAKYVGQASYFVTLCCEERRHVFSNAASAMRLIEITRGHAGAYRFAVHAYCVMPDHFHLLAVGLEPASDLLGFVKNVKQTSSREYLKKSGQQLWQKKFYDRILRERDNFDGVAAYIWMNPVRKGLCADARDYPFSGSFVVDWKKIVRPLESWMPEWKRNRPARETTANSDQKSPKLPA
jgi:putative transposase